MKILVNEKIKRKDNSNLKVDYRSIVDLHRLSFSQNRPVSRIECICA